MKNTPEISICKQLFVNYLMNSCGDFPECEASFKTNIDSVFSENFTRKQIKEIQNTRIFFVLGAGYSQNQYIDIPSKDLPQKIIQKLSELFASRYSNLNKDDNSLVHADKKRIQDELVKEKRAEYEEYINNYIRENNHRGMSPVDLSLEGLCEMDDNAMIQVLKQLLKPENKFSVTTELIVHLLKFRLVDVLINFNYDTTIDEIISQHFSPGEFNPIFKSDRVPPVEQYLNNDRNLDKPIYVKPHGSLQDPDSLYFVKKSAHNANQSPLYLFIADLLKQCVTDKKNIQFVFVGHDLSRSKINEFVTNIWKTEKHFKHILPSINTLVLDSSPEDVYRGKLTGENHHLFNIKYVQVRTKRQLKNYISSWWKNIRSLGKQCDVSINEIHRHELLYDLHNELSILNHSDVQYLRDRLLIECCIHYLQTNGILHHNSLMNSRVEFYFREYNRLGGQSSVVEILEKLGITVYRGTSRNAFSVRPIQDFEAPDFTEKLANKLLELLNLHTAVSTFEALKKKVKKHFHLIKENNLLYIKAYQDDHLLVEGGFGFKPEQKFQSHLDWVNSFKSKVDRYDEWNCLVAVSERGRFLSNKGFAQILKKIPNPTIEIIEADYDIEVEKYKISSGQDNKMAEPYSHNQPDKPMRNEFIQEKNNGNPNYWKSVLPWYYHHHHMVLFLKLAIEAGEPKVFVQYGYYFEDRLLSGRISPILITDRNECELLFKQYLSVRIRSTEYVAELPHKILDESRIKIEEKRLAYSMQKRMTPKDG